MRSLRETSLDDSTYNVQQPLVGRHAPDFDLPCTRPVARHPGQFKLSEHLGRWVFVYFYPRDFPLVTPAELISVSARIGEFWRRNATVIAISTDPVDFHQEWIETAPADGGVGPLRFPLASDADGIISRRYGVYLPDQRVNSWGLFIVDPYGLVQYQVLYPVGVGRTAEAPLRVLDALRAGGTREVGWRLGDGSTDPTQTLRDGATLGHYRVKGPLGKGAFAQVFRAWDLWLQRDVAIKVLRPGARVDVDVVLHEARAAAVLNHPSICTVYTVEEHEGLPVIVMELLEGLTLRKRLELGHMAPVEIRRVARGVASAMAACHDVDLVHGDLKPANIMLAPGGRPKILDFGIARLRGKQVLPSPSGDGFRGLRKVGDTVQTPPRDPALDGPDEDLEATLAGKVGPLVVGTPAYMAPERAQGAPATPSSDVFSLGVVLFQMATGRPPFHSSSLLDLLDQLQTADLRRLARVAPEPFHTAVAAALIREPGKRATMQELLELL